MEVEGLTEDEAGSAVTATQQGDVMCFYMSYMQAANQQSFRNVGQWSMFVLHLLVSD